MSILKHLIFAIAILPAMADAQDLIPGLRYSGLAKVENLSVNGVSRRLEFVDFDMGYRMPVAEGFQVGADLGLDLLQSKGKRGDAIYAAAVLETPIGAISVGLPRMVMQQVFPTPAFAGSSVLSLFYDIQTGDVVRGANLLDKAPPLHGLRYDGTFGAFRIAAALHEFDDSEAPLQELAVTYDGGTWQASVGGQYLDVIVDTMRSIKASIKGRFGKLTAGAIASRQHLSEQAFTAVTAFGSYQVNDRLQVEAQVINLVMDSNAEKLWGVNATYALTEGAYLNAGFARADLLTNSVISVGFGYKF